MLESLIALWSFVTVIYLQTLRKYVKQKQEGIVLLILPSSLWTLGKPQTFMNDGGGGGGGGGAPNTDK